MVPVIDISSDESSPTKQSSLPVKRTSSDVSFSSHTGSSSKRIKREAIAEKENVFSSPISKFKGKGREMSLLSEGFPPERFLPLDDTPTKVVGLDQGCHADLKLESHKTLASYLSLNMERQDQIKEELEKYSLSENKRGDVPLLKSILNILSDRVSAILKELQSRAETGASLSPTSTQYATPMSKVASQSMSNFSSGAGRPRPVAKSLHHDSSNNAQQRRNERSRVLIAEDELKFSQDIETSAVDDESVALSTDMGPSHPLPTRVTKIDILGGRDTQATVIDSKSGDLSTSSNASGPAIRHSSHFAQASSATTSVTKSDRSRSDQTTTLYYPEIVRVLKHVFSLRSFRTNQLEAINATLAGNDVFVLMPTGGGKSLCFQLPALCTTGKTKGVTFIISPLISLMRNHVAALRDKGVDVLMWEPGASPEERERVHSRLRGPQKPSMVYVSPERLHQSAWLNSQLKELHSNGYVARFVIDEAHCISTWGRDFRDAYTHLRMLRQQYPDVPIMALTATANNRVSKDIITQLQMRNPTFLRQSFNRPNLFYEIRQKKKGSIKDMAEWISEKHPYHSGIVYCNSRDDCEKNARDLRNKFTLSAKHYHAGMPPEERDTVQEEWQSGRCRIIVATIAFGMGIDKADVRFVVHRSMPKSLDGYYQETGRAGRDGQPADCLLYYSYADCVSQKERIKNPYQVQEGKVLSPEDITRQIEDLDQVARYCRNETDCRRSLLLHHYDEKFDAKDCGQLCDNCADIRVDGAEFRDFTEDAANIVRLVQELTEKESDHISKTHLTFILKGNNVKEVQNRGHQHSRYFGIGRHLHKDTISRLIDRLLETSILSSYEVSAGRAHYHSTYITLGTTAFLNSDITIILKIKEPITSARVPKKGPRKNPASTTVQVASLYEEEPITSFDDEALDDALDDEDDSTGKTCHDKSKLQAALERHRAKLAKDNFVTETEIFDDEIISSLSIHCPTDSQAFIHILRDADLDEESANRAWEYYGKGIVDVCIAIKLGEPAQADPGPSKPTTSKAATDTATLYKQFSYKGRNTGGFKFGGMID